MAIMVDLDKVKEIIGNENVYENSVVAYRKIMSALNALAYGKTWECLNCGKRIYFDLDKDYKMYRHLTNRMVRCDGCLGENVVNQIAIPKPEDMED